MILVVEDSLSNSSQQVTVDRNSLMMPSYCKVDENVTPINCDPGLVYLGMSSYL